MDIFDKLKSGEPVDMMSAEYRPAVDELHRADRALYRRRALITDPAAQMQGFVHERLYTLDEVFGNSETPVQ